MNMIVKSLQCKLTNLGEVLSLKTEGERSQAVYQDISV